MRKLSFAVVVAVCMVAGVGSASAASYTFSWKNNMNMFTYSNNKDAVCKVITELRTGAGAVATNTTPILHAEEKSTFTLSAPVCNLLKVTATCTFKDYEGKTKTETKTMTNICKGGEGYLSPSPLSKQWTTFQISLY